MAAPLVLLSVVLQCAQPQHGSGSSQLLFCHSCSNTSSQSILMAPAVGSSMSLAPVLQPQHGVGSSSWYLQECCSSATATTTGGKLHLIPPGVLLQCFSHSRVLIAPPCSFRSSILLLQPQYGDHPLNTFHQESCSSTPRQSMLLAVSPGPFRNPSAISPAPCQLFLGLCGEWISGNTSIVSWGQDHLDLSARQCKDRLAWTGQEAASACL